MRESRIARQSGFGLSAHADGYLFRPTGVDQIRALFQMASRHGRKIVLRGSGRSYGDSSILGEAVVLDCTRMSRILSWNPSTGVLECEAGATIETLWRYGLEDGWWPPVVSGTMTPTLGGALAMNIHGKNNYCKGTLGEQILELDLLAPNGQLVTLTPEDDMFYAAISGLGLLGVITRVKIQMKRISSGNLKVLAESPPDLEGQFQLFERFEHDADYMVSWVDCFARGAKLGRGQFHGAWYVHRDPPDWASLRPDAQDLPDTILGFLPKSIVWRFLRPFNNRTGMRFINWAKDKASRTLGHGKMVDQSLVAFSFLLDYVPNWRRAYLPGGFIQYQSFVPKETAREVFAKQIELQQRYRLESFLGVMKRHRPDKFLLSHAVDGYSMALDFKVTERNWAALQDLCHRMNELVIEAGGRFYFAKDSILNKDEVRRYLGDETVAEFWGIKNRLDPEGLLSSAQGIRVGLANP